MPYTINNGLCVPDALAGAAITGGAGLGADTYVPSQGSDTVIRRPMSTFAWSPGQRVRDKQVLVTSQGGRHCRACVEPLPIGLWNGYHEIPTDRSRNVSAPTPNLGPGQIYNFVGQLQDWGYPEDTKITITRYVRFYGKVHTSWEPFVSGRKRHGKHEVVFVFDNRLPYLAHIELDASAGVGAVPWLDNMWFDTPEQRDVLNEVADILVAEGITEAQVYDSEFTFYHAMPRARFTEGMPCKVDLDGERCEPAPTGSGCKTDRNGNVIITRRGTPGTQTGDKQRRYPKAERRCQILENCPAGSGEVPRRLANDPVAPCRHLDWNASRRAWAPPAHRPGVDGRGEIQYHRQWGATNVVASAYINRILNRYKFKHVSQHLVDGGGLLRSPDYATFSLSGMFERMVDHVFDSIQERVQRWNSDPWALVSDIGFGVMCATTGGVSCTVAFVDACVGVGCAAVGISDADGNRWLRLGNGVAAAASGDISGVLSVQDLPALTNLNRDAFRKALPLFDDVEGLVGSGAPRPRGTQNATGARMAAIVGGNTGLLDAVRAQRTSTGVVVPFMERALAPNRHVHRGRSDLDLARVWRDFGSNDWIAAASMAQIMARRYLLRVSNSRDSRELDNMRTWGVYDWQGFAVDQLARWWKETNGYNMPDFQTISISAESLIWAESAMSSVLAGVRDWMAGIRGFADVRRQLDRAPLERVGTLEWKQRIAVINTALKALRDRRQAQFTQVARIMQRVRVTRQRMAQLGRLQLLTSPRGADVTAALRDRGVTTTQAQAVQAAGARALQRRQGQ